MNKEKIHGLSIFALSIAMVGLIVFSVFTAKAKEDYKQEIVARDNAAFYNLMNDMDMLNTSLSKLSIGADCAMNLQFLADVWRQAGETGVSLSNVNMNDETKSALSAFINRISDYAQQLLLHVGSGETLTQQDKDQLLSVKDSCSTVYNNLSDALSSGYTADLYIDAYAIDESGSAIDFSSQEYPRLIYDGAFSESLEDDPINLTLQQVDEEAALRVAKAFSGLALTFQSTTEGEQPFYTFAGDSDYGSVEVYITKHGGLVLGFTTATSGGLEILPTYTREQQLLAIAKQYLLEKGWPECESGYIQYYNGSAVINMVPLQDGARLYPDLIKVSVYLENSAVVAVDATNYVASHMRREIPVAAISSEQARSQVSNLTIKSEGMAVIPKDTGKEVYCYEFFCNDGSNDFIVYVDAQTGKVSDILQIIHINNGTLTK